MPKKKSEMDKTPNPELLERSAKVLLDWESKPLTPEMKRILAVDPGISELGICFFVPTEEILITSKINLPKFNTIGARVYYIFEVLGNWIRYYYPDLIVKEGPSFSKFGACDSGRVQFAVEAAAIKYSTPLITIPPMSLRKFLGSSGKGKTKSDNKLQVYKKWGVDFPSEDETEAYGLAQAGKAISEGTFSIESKSRKKKVIE